MNYNKFLIESELSGKEYERLPQRRKGAKKTACLLCAFAPLREIVFRYSGT
jgi:hypothetical protein